MRATNKAIRDQITELQRLGADIAMESQSGIKLGIKFTNKSEDRDLTVRMSTSTAQTWLDGFKTARNQQ